MRALTVQQPWAWAIIHAGPPKDVENRTRNVAGGYRGPVAIHAGLAKPEKHNLASLAHRAAHGTEAPTELVFGAFIGVVDLVAVHEAVGEYAVCCSSRWGEPHVMHLELANPRPLVAPVPARGRLGLWTPTVEQLLAIHERIGHAA